MSRQPTYVYSFFNFNYVQNYFGILDLFPCFYDTTTSSSTQLRYFCFDFNKMSNNNRIVDKPSWLGGIIAPSLVGCGLSFVLPGAASVSYYVLAGWQGMMGTAMMLHMSPNHPRRLAELQGVSWLGLAYLTYAAAGDTDNPLSFSIVLASLVVNDFYAIAAGPLRLGDASDAEKTLVPATSLIVALAGSMLFSAKS
jgi:hypothetical protein